MRCYSGAGGLNDFLSASRGLVNLLPLTPETQDILNRDTLARLQPGGYLINVARGAHLVEDDLLALLDSGHLAGAQLDVFRTEPLPAGHPFWNHPRITLTPHTSARTLRDESIAQIGRWPWRRPIIAALVSRFAAMQPRTLGIDIVFAEPATDPRDDEILAAAFERACATLQQAGARLQRIAVPGFAELGRLHARGTPAGADAWAWPRQLLTARGSDSATSPGHETWVSNQRVSKLRPSPTSRRGLRQSSP